MNHSKAFWAVRNQYAEQMRILWSRRYTGEGLWGRGASLKTGEFENNTVRPDEILPEHLCGGTYRSRRTKRKAKQQLSYQERKERRILRKFGANGVALGEDEDVKAQLEKGKRTQAKPRVAGSNRGRELRAAAALARFGQQQKPEAEEVKKPTVVDDDETASEEDPDETASESEQEDATVDINGQRLLDKKGHGLVKVCEDENPEDDDARNELRELQSSVPGAKHPKQNSDMASMSRASEKTDQARVEQNPQITIRKLPKDKAEDSTGPGNSTKTSVQPSGVCPLCSFNNGSSATICSICSHVLDPKKVPDSWKCRSLSCKDSLYLNAGDSGICGVCGERKGSSA